ncbi:Mesaconyl-C(4)-CoA hydratase [Paramyrothecium foliicola]|nr:Mesaconyl-C(4)-CoA hydratase [Paramyrothecium foliicola]
MRRPHVLKVAVACRRCAQPSRCSSFSTTATPLSSKTPPPAAPSSLQHIFNEMKQRPAKIIPDYLTPMPSHLLTTMLNDLQPPPPGGTVASTLALPCSTPVVSQPPLPLPQGHHLVYFPIQLAPSQLVPDGTDPDHSPDVLGFPRRMWAGGEVTFRSGWQTELLMDGRPWLCKEDVANARALGKEGEEKVFVDVRRRYGLGHGEVTGAGDRPDEAWQIEERRTLVFLRSPSSISLDARPTSETAVPSAPSRIIKCSSRTPRPMETLPTNTLKAPHRPDFKVSLVPSAIHLFNFSALTYNAHAIHLDRRFAESTDGHRSLLVHGPLTLALMLRVLGSRVDAAAAVSSISYRNHAPLYVDEELSVCVRKAASRGSGGADRWDVWIEGPDGGLAVKGSAVVE